MDNNTVSIDTSLDNKTLFKKFAVPMIIAQVVMTIIQLGDRIIGSIYIGTNTLQIVTIVFPVLSIAMAFGVMIMTGLGVEVNYLIGRKKDKEAHSVATFIFIFQLLLSVLVASTILLFDDQIVTYLIGSGDMSIKEDALTYLRIICFAFPFFGSGFTLSSLILADGNANYNMIGNVLFALGNVIINAILVIGFDAGVRGLAAGTLFSSIIFTIYNSLYFILKINKSFRFGKFAPHYKELGRVIYNGSSDFVVVGAYGIMMISINRIIQNNMTTEFFLAYSLLMMIVMLYTSVAEGAIYGVTPIISKLYGERDVDRIKGLSLYAYIRGIAVSAAIFVILIPFATSLGSLFLTPPEGITDEMFEPYKAEILDILFKLYITYGFVRIFNINSTYSSGLLSAVKEPLLSLITSVSKTIIFIPLFTVIMTERYGDNGLVLGAVVSEVLFIPVMLLTLRFAFKSMRKKSLNE